MEESEVKQPIHAGEFQIEQLFGSKTRVRLLYLFLDNSERSYYVRELTRRIDAQLNSVRRELVNLVELNIVLEVEGKIMAKENEAPAGKGERRKYYKANTKFPFFTELRSIMKKSAILMNRSFVQELSLSGPVDLLFLTGRFIDNDRVPSDILIVGDVNLEAMAAAIKNFEHTIGREINYTYMPRDEFLYRREVKDRFLSNLIGSEKVVLINTIAKEI